MAAAIIGMLLPTWTTAGSESPRPQESNAEESETYAQIRFADLGGIEDWKALDSNRLLIEGRNGRQYEATFFGACPSLRFVETIGFVTDSTGDLDRFSSILVDGERCWFRTFERVDVEAASE